MVVGGDGEESVEMGASARKVIGVRRGVQGIFPQPVVVKLGSECFVSSFT